jgi:hypothetical protein
MLGPPRCCYPKHHRFASIFHRWNQAFRIVGFLGRSPNINPPPDVGNNVIDDSSDHIAYLDYLNHIIIFNFYQLFSSNQRFTNCNSTVDIKFLKFSVLFLWKQGLLDEFRQCAAIPFLSFWFLATIPISWWCLPMVSVCCHVWRLLFWINIIK